MCKLILQQTLIGITIWTSAGASMIWHQFQATKSRSKDLHVILYDLTNTFWSVPHYLISSACDYMMIKVPEVVGNLVKWYIQDINLCQITPGFTTGWQRLELGVVAGYTVSPLAFTIAMEVIRTSKSTSLSTNLYLHGWHDADDHIAKYNEATYFTRL